MKRLNLRTADWSNEQHGIYLYHGDSLEIMRDMEPGVVDAVVTDPVWPDNAVPEFSGFDPVALCQGAMTQASRISKRIAVHLGCDTSPQHLFTTISLPFFRVAWLRYSRPGYKGRLLNASDVAYLWGAPPASRKGAHIIPGEVCKSKAVGRITPHPCERSQEHVEWLVKWWSAPGEIVLDPFMGSGTTGEQCVRLGRQFIGIEIEREWFDYSVQRIEQAITEKESDMFYRPPTITASDMFKEQANA